MMVPPGRCWRFPWLPRGWWMDYHPSQLTALLTKEQELQLLKDESKAIEMEISDLKRYMEEVRKKIAELEEKK